MVELYHIFIVHDTTSNMPQLNSVVDTQPWASGSSQDVFAVRTPFAQTGVSTLNGTYLIVVFLEIINVHLSCQISEPRNQYKTAGWGEEDRISRAQWEVVCRNRPLIKDRCLCRHVSVHHSKLFGVGGPRHVMNWTLLVKSYPRIKSTTCAQHVECSLSVVTLACLVDLCLRKNNQGGTQLIPLQLDLVALEEGLLRYGAGELRDVENLDGSWLALMKEVSRSWKYWVVELPCALG